MTNIDPGLSSYQAIVPPAEEEWPDVHPCETCRYCGFIRRGNHVTDFCAYELMHGVEREVSPLEQGGDACSDYRHHWG